MLPNGQGIRQMMITIRREGDEWAEGIDTSKELVRECTLSAPEILARIKEAGIVGMGGAAFPTERSVVESCRQLLQSYCIPFAVLLQSSCSDAARLLQSHCRCIA